MERTLERLPEVWGRAKTNEDLLMSDFSRRSSAVQRSAMARKRVKFFVKQKTEQSELCSDVVDHQGLEPWTP